MSSGISLGGTASVESAWTILIMGGAGWNTWLEHKGVGLAGTQGGGADWNTSGWGWLEHKWVGLAGTQGGGAGWNTWRY